MSLELNSCVLIDYRLWAAKSEGRQWVEHCIEQCKAQQVLKKIGRLASVFPSPPFRSSDFAGPRRPRLYGFHTSTGSLSNRKGHARRSGGREREPRRAGEGRSVWNRNSCVLIDYGLWAAKK